MTFSGSRTLWTICAGFAFTTYAGETSAQTLGLDVSARDLPPWMEMWSPLSPSPGSRMYSLPATGGAIPRLLLPSQRVGLLWTAGHAAALPMDVKDQRTDFAVTAGRREGEFRRPFDAPVSETVRLIALGWRPVSSRSAMVGRVAVTRESRKPSPWSTGTQEYDASPFGVADTSTAPLQRAHVQLDGAAGWRLGTWGVGLGAGYATRDQHSDFAAIARGGRDVSTALAGSVSRRVGGLNAGIQIRWRADAATLSLVRRTPNSEPKVYELLGIRPVRANPVTPSYFRRSDATSPSFGVGIASAHRQDARFAWATSGEVGRRGERYRHQANPSAPIDRWNSRGASLNAAFQQRGLRVGRNDLLITATSRAEWLRGEASLATRPGIDMYRASDRVIDGDLEVRLVPGKTGWGAAINFGVTNSRRVQTDSNTTLRSDIATVAPRIAAELGRSVTRRWYATAGIESALIRPSGTVPSFPSPTESNRLLTDPDLAIAASMARAAAVSVSIRRTGEGRDISTALRAETVRPTDALGNQSRPGAAGRRVVFAIVAAVTLHGKAQPPP